MPDESQVKPEDLEDPLSNFEPAEYGSRLERALAEESVAAMETRPYETVEVSASVGDAVAKLQESGSSCLLVIDDDRLVGILTERDVLEKVAEQYDRHREESVANFMTAGPTIVYDCDQPAAAVAAIAVAGHRHVPVLDLEEKLVGLISPKRTFEFIEPYLE